ncbi:MAG: dihydroorotate dehydrogenase electron transfer subunit [Candidatus Saccharimonas sp.]|nr:dihydroorotate dehydrogenase electron transfer subunit [Planctomycetaceae bacterium]
MDFCLPGLVRTAVQCRATVVGHEQMARNTWRMRLECPEIARQILPGQFFMVRLPGRSDPLLGRPFALYDVYCDEPTNGKAAQPRGVDFGYVVVGKMTTQLESLVPGDEVELWGPLGNGFPAPPSGHLVIVAGGIGQTPFLAVIREALRRRVYGQPPRELAHVPSRITLCYGVRSSEYLAGVEEFQREGIDVRIATDDGSVGHHGFVTDLLKQLLAEPSPPDAVYCCGPEPLMHAVAKLTDASDVPCLLSLETPMACGFGACFSCVTKVKQDDGSWDYRRVCVEGPVFPARQLVLD